jgi:hypothetical protein
MTSAQIKKQNRIAKLQKMIKSNNSMIDDATESLLRGHNASRCLADIELFKKENQRIVRNLERLGAA